MAESRNRDGLVAAGAIAAGCAAASAAMLMPYGDRERIMIAVVAGVFAALFVVGAALIARRIAARPPREDDPEEEFDMLTLRPEDVHPDAPPRRPIFAVSDLGMPEPEEQSIPALLERFERGLERRTAQPRPEVGERTEEAPPADIDDALRDALGTLKQMASRVR